MKKITYTKINPDGFIKIIDISWKEALKKHFYCEKDGCEYYIYESYILMFLIHKHAPQLDYKLNVSHSKSVSDIYHFDPQICYELIQGYGDILLFQEMLNDRLSKMRTDNPLRTIPQLITKNGAHMGRAKIGTHPPLITSGPNGKIFDKNQIKVFDRKVPMCSCCGAYDEGGAYWGIGKELRVMFTADLSYVEFYRIP